MARQFGVITVGGTAAITGIVANSFEISDSIEKAQARNEVGKVTDTKAYSKGTSISVRGKLDTTLADIQNDLKAGDIIEIAGGTFMIDSVTVTENNTDFADVALTASNNDESALEAYA